MAKHIHKSIPAITRRALERYGFAYAEILSHWPIIVGVPLAAFSAPERIRWPTGPGSQPGSSRRRTGGTLIVRVADGRAVELQHETPRIIDRVNTYYGYEAITHVKFVQGTLPQRSVTAPAQRPAPLAPEREAVLAQSIGALEEGPLRTALEKFGRGALARRKT
jgi:hypothetical protein